jgi:TRAP-type C4-dicarboxylate transport system substrate-binding protein
MGKHRSRFIVTVFCLFLGIFAASTSSKAEPIELRVSSHMPEQHFIVQKGLLPWSAEVEKRTGGKVKFKFYLGGSLVKANQACEAVKSGMVDMAAPMPVFAVESQFPVAKVLTLPFLYDSGLQANLTLLAGLLNIPAIKTEFVHMKILGAHMTDSVNLGFTAHFPKTLQELKGLNVFAGSRTSVQLLSLLGATPRSIKLEDVLMSLQRKDIDGVLFPTAPLTAYKITDVVNKHIIVNAAVGAQPVAMNLKKWASLPQDVRAVFDDLSVSLTALLGTLIDQQNEHIMAQLQKRGDSIYRLPNEERERWRQKTEPICSEWLQEMKGKGIDGQSILSQVRALSAENAKKKITAEAWWGLEARK